MMNQTEARLTEHVASFLGCLDAMVKGKLIEFGGRSNARGRRGRKDACFTASGPAGPHLDYR